MKILALETSAVACSACLCEDETVLAQTYQNSGLTHSRTLLPMVQNLLADSGHGLEEVDVIAVAAGPGSFTGLRIGAATAKGPQALRPLLHPGVHGLAPGPPGGEPHRVRYGRPAQPGVQRFVSGPGGRAGAAVSGPGDFPGGTVRGIKK